MIKKVNAHYIEIMFKHPLLGIQQNLSTSHVLVPEGVSSFLRYICMGLYVVGMKGSVLIKNLYVSSFWGPC